MNTKKYHIILGCLLMIFGFVCTGFSIFNYIKPEIVIDINTVKEKAIADCQQNALNNGFSASRMGDEIIVSAKNSAEIFNNPMPSVYKSSIVIEKCENMHLSYYCIGEECSQKFVFKMIFPQK